MLSGAVDDELPSVSAVNEQLLAEGQTVNSAARIQALSRADKIVVTDYVLSLPGAAELVADLEIARSEVQLKGIAGDVAVHRLRGGAVVEESS
jgi:class 3 adenylate cyclase